ncbi:MAG: Methyltransferase domain protein [Planctomycetes bacterium ADurb.Bin126]|nr:MAG: Methyltransferase domain protein [Planctomycetes bacterium ADurb.Bin126]HOD84318.1 class I SAM-dependent methyltransferase [Phycisphaerae bacterium]
MEQMDKERWSSMADCYDRMADYLVPRYHMLQDEVIALLLSECKPELIVDLGGGSGIFIEKILDASPSSRAVWVDSSEDFRRVATKRLGRFGERVVFVACAFEDNWQAALPEAPDAICSMSAIHHLDTAGKRRFYSSCFETLRPGGWFYNIDEMSTLYDDAYRRTLAYWIRHVADARANVPPELKPYASAWCEKFDGWRKRNVENIGQPKQPGDDIHESFVSQMEWLREIGFVNVDLFIKFQLWSAIGGQKPAT